MIKIAKEKEPCFFVEVDQMFVVNARDSWFLMKGPPTGDKYFYGIKVNTYVSHKFFYRTQIYDMSGKIVR